MKRHLPMRTAGLLLLLALLWGMNGCATRPSPAMTERFVFPTHTFAYSNELVWVYRPEPASGKLKATRREPPGQYTHHCFVVARGARQFLYHARFDPHLAGVDEGEYQRRIKEVLSRSSTSCSTHRDKVGIPGYRSLREFSEDWESLLKAHSGGAWRSYFQRGHWRMIFPFSRGHQERTAVALREALQRFRPPVVHVVRFPSLSINHALLVYDSIECPGETRFLTYDPNNPQEPVTLTFDQQRGEFRLPRLDYFGGGRVAVYEIYRNGCY